MLNNPNAAMRVLMMFSMYLYSSFKEFSIKKKLILQKSFFFHSGASIIALDNFTILL